jgi:hypothetical protein
VSVRVRGRIFELMMVKRNWWNLDVLWQNKGMIALLAKTENEKYHDTFISDIFGMKQIQ